MNKLAAAMVLAIGLSGAAQAQDLVVYSAGPKPLSGKLAKDFTAKTVINVKLFQSNSGKVMTRYQAEKSNPQADIIISSSWRHTITLDKAGDLLAYAQGTAALDIAYNTKSGLTAQKQWNELINDINAANRCSI